jgi:hypothetical protein
VVFEVVEEAFAVLLLEGGAAGAHRRQQALGAPVVELAPDLGRAP